VGLILPVKRALEKKLTAVIPGGQGPAPLIACDRCGKAICFKEAMSPRDTKEPNYGPRPPHRLG